VWQFANLWGIVSRREELPMAFTSFGTDDGFGESVISAPNKELEKEQIERVIAENAETVYKLAYAKCGNRADADDVFQQVFLRYITKKPVFASAEHEKAWFIRVTVNCSKSLWSSAFRRKTQPLEGDIAVEAPEDSGLVEYLAVLPEKYRVLIHLFYYEGLPTAEIARLLKRRESTVRMQLTRARRLLRELMIADWGI
jgi:RNA polymerase sigma-70 factor (ECF subfamily)